MAELLDNCLFTAGSMGTADFADGAADPTCRNLEDAGAEDGKVYPYKARNATGTEWEIGRGTVVVSGGTWTLERTTIQDSSDSGNKINFGTHPKIFITAGKVEIGDVVGPASATDGAIAVFDGTTGKLIADSGVPIANLSAIATVAPPGDGIRVDGNVTIANGSNALGVVGAAFVSGDVGKLIVIPGAGADGATLVSTIAAVTGSENVTLADNAGKTLSGVESSVVYGTDMLAALQAVVDGLPADGGEIILSGKYLCSGTLEIGDGTSTTVSTRSGVRLRGVGAPQVLRDNLQPQYAQDEIIYAGAGGIGSGVIDINGPLSGWGVKNLGIDGSLLAGFGLTIMSAGLGRIGDLAFRGCLARSLNFDCYSNSGYSGDVSANSDLIVGDNIVIALPDAAHTIGIMLDGPEDGSASTCFVELRTVRIYMHYNHPAYGVYRKVADAVTIRNLLIIAGAPVHEASYGVVDDYTKNPIFPSGCVLDTPDVGWNIPEGRQFVTTGSPSEHARPNKICNLTELNGCRYPIGLPNTDLDLPALVGGKVSLTGQNSAITTTAILTPRRAGLYRVTYYMKVTAAGSAGTLTFNAVSHDPEIAGVPGQPVDVTVLNAHDQGSLVVYADGSNPIYYAVTADGLTAGSLEYRLDAVVERLC